MIFRVCCVKSTYICRGKLPQDRICVAAGLNSLCFESLNGRKRMSVSLIPVFSKQYNPSLLCRSIQTVCVFSNPRMVNMRIAHLYPRSIDVFLSCLKKCSLHIPIFFFFCGAESHLLGQLRGPHPSPDDCRHVASSGDLSEASVL